MGVERLVPAVFATVFIAEAAAPVLPTPISELGPFAQLGMAGVFLLIYWQERKERRERQASDDARYEALLGKLIDALKDRIK